MRYSPTAARAHNSYSIFYIEYSIVTSCNACEVNYSDATMASSSSSTSDQGPSWKDESDREPQVDSVLDKLRWARPSDLARKRNIMDANLIRVHALCAVVSTRIMVVYFYVLRIMGEINGNNDYTK